MRLEWEVVPAPLRVPLRSAHGEVKLRELVLVQLHDESSGLTGFGEAAPLASYDGVSLENVLAALADCAAVIAGMAGEVLREQLLAECTRVAVLPQAIAAVDLALWDLEGRRAGQPVWALLGAATAEPVEVNAAITAPDRAGAAAEADQARAAGYRCVKMKVGIGDDAGRVAAVRAAGGAALDLRLDANGAWPPAEAAAALGTLAPAGIECCEEPCHGLQEIAEVSAVSEVPLALDESARLPGAFDYRYCRAACLKLGSSAGITGILDAARRARAVGYEVYLASTWDGAFGIAGALHAAVALAPDRACGLATLGLFAGRANPLPATEGRIAVPAGPGLGDGLLGWYRS